MKTVFAILALAATATGAFASEATEFVDPPSTLTRAHVRAAIEAPSAVVQLGEATVFVDPPSTLTRAQVRAAIGSPSTVVQLGEATVFVDPAPAPALTETHLLARMAGRILNSRNYSEIH
jgi:hypothetical protein